jgi:ABC-type lipoprotein release transport system permease subunit
MTLTLATMSDGQVPVPMWVILAIEAALLFGLFVLIRIPLTYNVQNLTVRWKTTLMTALAFTLVVSLLTGMLSFVNGMTAMAARSGIPENVVVMAEGSTDESFSNLAPDGLGDIETQQGIAHDDKGPLSSRETYLIVKQPFPDAKPGAPNGRFLQLRGVEDSDRSAIVHKIQLEDGGAWFSEAGVRENKDGGQPMVECVIGTGVAGELGKDRKSDPSRPLGVGETFQLNDRPWIVTGVMQPAGTTFDTEVWAKRGLIGPMFGKNDCSSLVLRSESPEKAQDLADFLVNKDNKGYSKLKLAALTEPKYFNGLSSTSTTFTIAAWVVTGILAVGGVFGVLNTMFATVSQRIKDIGVLRLLGFPKTQILVSFLLESVMIALIGGLLGCLFGSLVHGFSVTSILAGEGGGKTVSLQLLVTLPTLLAGLLLSVFMGFIGGLLPALNAMRMSSLDALR